VWKLQERATSAITDAFKNMMPAEAIVIRDGAEATYPASELVVGDIVKLRPGSRVPADLRLIHVSGLKARWFPQRLCCIRTWFSLVHGICRLKCRH
jgi:magnesium-transporting ATPase (P-type)